MSAPIIVVGHKNPDNDPSPRQGLRLPEERASPSPARGRFSVRPARFLASGERLILERAVSRARDRGHVHARVET
ncbi:MAG: hypothetical protein ACLTMP_02145 [Eggerthella lenta]